MTADCLRIAMWSGPRNLSTAMMRSFGARRDCAVWDEPFYAAYLARTGLDHPMGAEIIAAGETDPEVVASRCAGDAPGGKRLFYQKHMTQHMIPGFPRGWMAGVVNVFLIRDPAQLIASYVAKRENPDFEEIGFALQAELFDEVADRGAGAQKDVEESHQRLAKRSRAVGLHVILATQRPSTDVITGVIKANLPAQIAFKVNRKIDSRVILDANGAEKLLGHQGVESVLKQAPAVVVDPGSRSEYPAGLVVHHLDGTVSLVEAVDPTAEQEAHPITQVDRHRVASGQRFIEELGEPKAHLTGDHPAVRSLVLFQPQQHPASPVRARNLQS